MSNPNHLEILDQGIEAWNRWRKSAPDTQPDLREANLRGRVLNAADLHAADLRGTDLSKAELGEANLVEANLSRAQLNGAILNRANLSMARLEAAHLYATYCNGARLDGAYINRAILNGAHLYAAQVCGAYLEGAFLIEAHLEGANLSMAHLNGAHLNGAHLNNADLSGADLSTAQLSGADLHVAGLSKAQLNGAILDGANLSGADLSMAHLNGANLSGARLIETDLSGAHLNRALLIKAIAVETKLTSADLTGCEIYGMSAWRLELDHATRQTGLVITRHDEPVVTVDDLEIAQFVYLLLHNSKIRHVVDSITSKVVLILGRFTEERKKVLDALRDALRKRDFVPVVFDFDKPTRRDLTETVQLLANLSRFVIADVTEAKSIPQELSHIIPFMPSVPILPIVLEGREEYALFEHWKPFMSVLSLKRYTSAHELISNLEVLVLQPITYWEIERDRNVELKHQNEVLTAEIQRLRQRLAEHDARPRT